MCRFERAYLYTAWPEEKSSHTVDAETDDEGPTVTKLSYNPTGVCERTDEVSAEVCSTKC